MINIKLENLNNESADTLKQTGIYTIEFKNNPNKYYVGSTQSLYGFLGRWKKHLHELKKDIHHSIKLQRACNKYGIENLMFKIIDTYSPEYCIGAEQYWINMLDSYKHGYNSRPKAENNFSCKHTPENMKFFSERMMGEKNPNFGKKFSKERRELQSKISSIPVLQLDKNLNIIQRFKSAKEATDLLNLSSGGITRAIKSNTTCGGFKWRKEGINEKIDEKIIKIFKLVRKESNHIIQLDLNLKFVKKHVSITEASKEVDADSSNINRVLNKHHLLCKNYFWIYEKDYNEATLVSLKSLLILKNNNIKERMLKIRGISDNTKTVMQHTLDGKFIKEWGSIKEASFSFNIKSGGISRVCSGAQKTSGGYIWKYKNI